MLLPFVHGRTASVIAGPGSTVAELCVCVSVCACRARDARNAHDRAACMNKAHFAAEAAAHVVGVDVLGRLEPRRLARSARCRQQARQHRAHRGGVPRPRGRRWQRPQRLCPFAPRRRRRSTGHSDAPTAPHQAVCPPFPPPLPPPSYPTPCCFPPPSPRTCWGGATGDAVCSSASQQGRHGDRDMTMPRRPRAGFAT